jgi:transposase-like protein
VVKFVRSESELIGGVGKVVEVDESKFGRRKHHRGRYVKGQWVFGGVEKGSGRTFLETVNDRSAETLIELIKKWIRPGTTVVTDCWAAYRSLPDEGFTHLSVNHSITFVDEDTGAHTNTMESTSKHVKATLNPYTRKVAYEFFLADYVPAEMQSRRHTYIL